MTQVEPWSRADNLTADTDGTVVPERIFRPVMFLACEKGNEVKGDHRRLKRVRIRLTGFSSSLRMASIFSIYSMQECRTYRVKHHFIAPYTMLLPCEQTDDVSSD